MFMVYYAGFIHELRSIYNKRLEKNIQWFWTGFKIKHKTFYAASKKKKSINFKYLISSKYTTIPYRTLPSNSSPD